MEAFTLSIYLGQVAQQARFGITAYDRAMTALEASTHRYSGDEWVAGGSEAHRAAIDEFWLQIQLFVNCAANVSRILWSQKRKWVDERADLRAAVGVNDPSPLWETLVRHDFEHIDERIRTWSLLPGMKLFADGNIGPRDRLVHTEPEPPETEDFFRHFDPATGVLSFWGDQLNVHVVAAELARVRDTATRANEVRPDRRG